MPPAAAADDENGPATPKSTPNIRRSPAKRTPRNGGTPTRKTEENKTPTPNAAGTKPRTPNSAPANVRRASKKAEPTLLGDFLLGRPSPQRAPLGTRRKSVDAVKKEMKLEAAVMGKVPRVGGVKDRVKQWQKASAADLAASMAEENKSESKSDEEEKPKAKAGDTNARPGRRKSKEAEDDVPKGSAAKDLAKKRSKSAGAPKKRVISDSHWMKTPEKKKSPPRKGQAIPKHFAALTNNPPLEQKIKDWAKRNASEEADEAPTVAKPLKAKTAESTPKKWSAIPADFLTTTNNPPLAKKVDDWIKRSGNIPPRSPAKRTPSYEKGGDTPTKTRPSPETAAMKESDTRRRKKSPRQEQANNTQKSSNPSRSIFFDDGIRIKPSPGPSDDGIRIKPSQGDAASPRDRDMRPRAKASSASPQEKCPTDSRTPQKKYGKERKLSNTVNVDDSISHSSCSRTSCENHEDEMSWTPSRRQSKRRGAQSENLSLDDIPLGNSAFSVLDLPVGAEAGTLRRRAPPKRTPSFGVPKVFKKVYNEARNIVHDTVDPQRPGVSEPKSIESWLNDTSDPFVDAPTPSDPLSQIPESPSGRCSPEIDGKDEPEYDDIEDTQPVPSENRDLGARQGDLKRESPNTREKLPSQVNSPGTSPGGLKRTPATRATPKSAKKTALKDAFLDAFRGESTTAQRARRGDQGDVSEMRGSRSPQEARDVGRDAAKGAWSKQSSPIDEDAEVRRRREEKQYPVLPRRPAPTTGDHCLSTIASVETFSTGSSLSETASELSKTTLTQDTLSTLPTESALSQNTNNSGLKRRLTKHSDLLSVLSLPDPAEHEGVTTIRSARSLRTTRVRLETATIRGLMKELSDDEAKYMRELNTLVDGVIPVLLSSVLSKSDSAVAAGLFDSNPSEQLDGSFTKPIVDMGVCLERLRSLHKRIPLGDPEAIISWAHGAQKTYTDYLAAWRLGFQDVVVNLAPAARSEKSPLDTMPLNANGDVVDAEGEVADVAFLLKRPLTRIKHLAKIFKGFDKLKHTDLSKMVDEMWEKLEGEAKRRVKQENARMVDRAANNTDATRARDLSTLALAEDTKIDRTRQVCAKDFFLMDMPHSSGQRIECQVELLLRDKPSDKEDDGDILICAVDDVSRWLLLAPLPRKYTSARMGDNPGQVVVLVRGISASQEEWQETFLLQTDDHEAAAEWFEMLGNMPIPPPTSNTFPPESKAQDPNATNTGGVDIPIGERRRREAEEAVSEQPDAQRKPRTTYVSINDDSMNISPQPKDLNDAMRSAGRLSSSKHARSEHNAPSPGRHAFRPRSSGSDKSWNLSGRGSSADAFMSGALPYIPDDENNIKHQRKVSSAQDDSPPPPPAHRTPVTPNTTKKPSLVLDSSTPRAKNRRTSSPLKHEYQPFDSPRNDDAELSDEDSSSDTDEELEDNELPAYQIAAAIAKHKRDATLASSKGMSQAPEPNDAALRSSRSPPAVKLTATMSSWNGQKGQWEELHPEQCSIVVSPGLIEAFELSAAHSLPVLNGGKQEKNSEAGRPLVALEITPFIKLRQSTAIDIEIHSAPKPNSLLKCKGAIRYRSPNPVACNQLYQAIHKSRLEIPAFLELERAGNINPYGAHSYDAAVKGRRNFFGRRRSYRASPRASPPSTVEPSIQSNTSSTFSRLKRLGGGGRFDISKSTVNTGKRRSFWSPAASNNGSRYSGVSVSTPPGTPPSLSLAYSIDSKYLANMGSDNIKVRLYSLEPNAKWDDKGEASVTFSQPPPGMRQALAINNGVENRVTVAVKVGKNDEHGYIVIDEVLGSNSFGKLGRTGVMFTVWEDIRGDGGEIGRIGRFGGVSGRTRKWLFQTNSAREAAWIYGLTQRSALTY